MLPKKLLAAMAMACTMSVSAFAADTAVTLSDVHLCCNSCVTGVDAAIKDVSGVKAVSDKDKGTIVLTASDTATAQKAVNALLAAGYFGKSSDSAIKVEALSGAKGEKVQKMTVEGVHLCCPKCVTAVKAVLTKVDGTQGNTVVQKAKTFDVTGNFNDKAVFDELNKAGLSGHEAK